MGLSIIGYQNTAGSPDYMVRHVQAAGPEEMEERVADDIAAVMAINGAIADPNERFVPVDANLAGGGDGHTFIFTSTLTRSRLAFVSRLILIAAGSVDLPWPGPGPTLPWPPPTPAGLPPESFVVKFGMASQRDAVERAIDGMVARALAEATTLNPQTFTLALWQQVAGAAKGTRFMGGVAMIRVGPPPPPPPP